MAYCICIMRYLETNSCSKRLEVLFLGFVEKAKIAAPFWSCWKMQTKDEGPGVQTAERAPLPSDACCAHIY